jgi:hypothetical protein
MNLEARNVTKIWELLSGAALSSLGSARASRATASPARADGVPPVADFSICRTLRRGAAMSTRGRVRSLEKDIVVLTIVPNARAEATR